MIPTALSTLSEENVSKMSKESLIQVINSSRQLEENMQTSLSERMQKEVAYGGMFACFVVGILIGHYAWRK
jgi:hypothetical protein